MEKRNRHALTVFGCHAPDFLERSNALEGFFNANHAQGFHSLAHGLILDDRGGGALYNQPADGFAYRERFDNCNPPEITAPLATIAPSAAVKDCSFCSLHAEAFENLRLRDKFLATVCAHSPDQPLGAGHENGTGNEKRFDAHVVETSNGAGGVVRVQRAQNLVTGEGRFDRDIGGFVVANFTNHHDVRVLAQDRPQGRGKIEADIAARSDLVNAHELVFDRVFDRDDVVFGAVQFMEN